MPDYIQLLKARTHFLGARLTLESALNLAKREEKLCLFHGKEICQYLQFGWPVGYEADMPPTAVQENHLSGRQHIEQVRKFVKAELSLGALVGPFFLGLDCHLSLPGP